MRTITLFSLFIILGILLPAPAGAEVIHAGPADDVEAIINTLVAGDELVLADGTYTITERFSFSLTGTQAAPIIIRAADGASPHFTRPDANQNIWDFSGTYLIIRGIEFSGGSAGLRVEGADHLTIEGCEIHDTEDVALRMNDSGVTYQSVSILSNHIHDTGGTGEGMYLGCNGDDCRLLDAVIAGNYVHHTNAAAVSQGDGIELKEGSAGCVIADNVIHDTNYPCILTYSAAGNGAANIIERNVMWNCGDHAIQSAQDAIIRNNIILGATYDGISLQPHQNGAPGNQVVVHNTVFNAGGNAIVVRNATGDVVVANNAVYASGGLALRVVGATGTITFAGNVGTGGTEAVSEGYTEGSIALDFVDAHYDGAPPIDCYPADGGGLVSAASSQYLATDDFNGTLRSGSLDVGAYLFEATGNPGWTIAPEFKPEVVPATPVCGDGAIGTGESCDDGNTQGGDGCDSTCDVEPGYTCAGEPSLCEEVSANGCGDGVIDAGEACDDGNTEEGDGCDSACALEAGYTCTGQPSECVQTSGVCGDGVVDVGEDCDDGNNEDGDGCPADCMLGNGSDSDSGCGCSTPGSKPPHFPLALALCVAAVLLSLRRRAA